MTRNSSYRHNPFTIFALIAFFILLMGYAYFEARTVLSGPQITLESPSPTAMSEPLVTIRGTSKNVATLSVNGAPATLSVSGVFETNLLMAPGYNTIALSALDTLGREVRETVTVLYEPTSATTQGTPHSVTTLTHLDEIL